VAHDGGCSARACTPLFVVAGAANRDPWRRAFTDSLNGLVVSGFAFGDTAR